MSSVDFLFELGTEELPPTTLSTLSRALEDNLRKGLEEQQLGYDTITSFATPRRLAVVINGLNEYQPDTEQTRLGPAVAAAYDADGQPTKAAQGFARSCNLEVSELDQIDTDKGPRLGVKISNKGKPARDLLGDIIRGALNSLPIAKGMRWGNRDETFVRPVKWIIALLGNDVLDLELFGCSADRITWAHRFMSDGSLTLDGPTTYAEQLKKAHVVADQDERKAIISDQVNALAANHSLTAVIDRDLLDEVSALVEWPVALLGQFEEGFLSVPKEALISTMSKNQKYFHLLTGDGKLANHFITIANLESSNPQAIIEGNEKVIRPRLADAKFFFDIDSKQSLTQKAKQLESIVFQTKLGSVADKCKRIGLVAKAYAKSIGADETKVETAAGICKADLVTEMVGEFPSLQGIMGNYYAQNEGLDNEVCQSLEEIYLPKSASDNLPTTAVGVGLALADRIDTLVGIFGINQRPSGNKDPYALRRAALGIIRIILERHLEIDLRDLIKTSISSYSDVTLDLDTEDGLIEFFASRTRAMYLDHGYSAQEVSAVESLNITLPVDFDKRLSAVKSFALKPESESLSATNKRVANILAKNDAGEAGSMDESLATEPAEKKLLSVLNDVGQNIPALCASGDYVAALEQLTAFTAPLEDFFDQVMVMVEDEAVKNNRIALLAAVRKLFLSVADISCLQK